MNRRVLLNTILGGVFGIALAAVGFPWHTWQFWLLFGVYLATTVNSLIQPRS
jgi:hypothetical protein